MNTPHGGTLRRSSLTSFTFFSRVPHSVPNAKTARKKTNPATSEQMLVAPGWHAHGHYRSTVYRTEARAMASLPERDSWLTAAVPSAPSEILEKRKYSSVQPVTRVVPLLDRLMCLTGSE